MNAILKQDIAAPVDGVGRAKTKLIFIECHRDSRFGQSEALRRMDSGVKRRMRFGFGQAQQGIDAGRIGPDRERRAHEPVRALFFKDQVIQRLTPNRNAVDRVSLKPGGQPRGFGLVRGLEKKQGGQKQDNQGGQTQIDHERAAHVSVSGGRDRY